MSGTLWFVATFVVALVIIAGVLYMRFSGGKQSVTDGGKKVMKNIIIVGIILIAAVTVYRVITTGNYDGGIMDEKTVTSTTDVIFFPGSGFHGDEYSTELYVIPDDGKVCSLTYSGCVDITYPLSCTKEMKSSYCEGKMGEIVIISLTMCGPDGSRADGKGHWMNVEDDVHSKKLSYGRIITKRGSQWVALEDLRITSPTMLKIAANTWKYAYAAGRTTVNKESPIKIQLECH